MVRLSAAMGTSKPTEKAPSFEVVLTVAYLGCNIAAELLYIPQLVRVIREPEASKGLSLITWGGWCCTSLVSLAYMWFALGDWPASLMTGTNTIFLILTTAFLLLRRAQGFRTLDLLSYLRDTPN